VGRITIHFLLFDDENADHIHRHGVTPEEIEQMTGNKYATARNTRFPANRVMMFGQTDGGRALSVVLEATHDEVVWRPVTAWDSTPEERQILGRQ
jgi:uncharacterized DUF497 family protein